MRISAVLFVGLVACAGATPDPTTPIKQANGSGGAGATAGPGPAGDVSLDIGPVDIKGVLFEPLALGRPGMPLVGAKKKMTLEKHRAEYAKAKDPVVKQAEAAIIATMLYEKSKTDNEAAQKQDLNDARQIMRDAQAAVGNKVDDLTLQLVGSYEVMLEDFAAAEKAWGDLVTAAPKDKAEPTNRAWWAYSMLREGKNAEALDAVNGEKQPVGEKTPELAYIAAWAKWRTGDFAGAWTNILQAWDGWGNLGNKDALEFELFVMAGHSNVPMQQEVKDLMPRFVGKSKDATLQYKLLTDLATKAYGNGGRWADVVATMDAALALKGNNIPPPEDVPAIRYDEADATVRLDDPATTVKLAKQAIDALGPCGQKCAGKDTDNLLGGAGVIAKLFYYIYASAHDDRYYQPAHDLYEALIVAIKDNAAREPVVKERNELERWQKTYAMKGRENAGTHDKGAIGALLSRHNQEVQACYEIRLSGNPKLAGTLVVTLESDQTGEIKGVSTDPKAGQADMAAVAACAAEHARAWKLPKTANGSPAAKHSTRIKLTFNLAKK